MIYVDDRTPEEHETHTAECLSMVASRGEMKRVRIVSLRGYRPKGVGHCHIYVYREADRT
jgi:hypothetical protein